MPRWMKNLSPHIESHSGFVGSVPRKAWRVSVPIICQVKSLTPRRVVTLRYLAPCPWTRCCWASPCCPRWSPRAWRARSPPPSRRPPPSARFSGISKSVRAPPWGYSAWLQLVSSEVVKLSIRYQGSPQSYRPHWARCCCSGWRPRCSRCPPPCPGSLCQSGAPSHRRTVWAGDGCWAPSGWGQCSYPSQNHA